MAGFSVENVCWIVNPNARKNKPSNADISYFSSSVTRTVREFHRSLPGFRPTPLAKLDHLAEGLGVGGIRVKDESFRCGLNAFKILGASYALSSYLVRKFNHDFEKLTFGALQSQKSKSRIRNVTCITATDGNHGRAVAWAAQQLGCRAVVYMPQGTTPARLQSIEDLGADVDIIDGNYDDAVRKAADDARRNQWLLLQDTIGPGNEDIPIRVMQGYLTMFAEAFDQLGEFVPTHVFIQCGVGSLAGSLQAYLAERFGSRRPMLTIVEPTKAACYYESMTANDGNPRKVKGSLNTIMAGLACGEPNILSWRILREFADVFAACPDEVTVKGMRVMANPIDGDDRVVSGESGAVTLGLLVYMMEKPGLEPLKKALNIQPDSRFLLFSTEGDTDPDMYRKIVWG
jgi:diaminopropionate ammonia-lyase